MRHPVQLPNGVQERGYVTHGGTFGVPFLTQEGNHSPMFDRFAVTVRINKLRGDLEHFAVRQRDSFRVKLIAKVASFEEDAEFTLVDPRYPSVMTRRQETSVGDDCFSDKGVDLTSKACNYM